MILITVCFHRDAVLLCTMKHCYWEHSMVSSWHSIVMRNEALLLRTQYAFIMAQYFMPNEALLLKTQYAFNMTQYCYALWSAFTESTVCFCHDTGMVCTMKQCYWEHSLLSSWHSIVMPCEVLLLRAQYAFIMTQYCYALWSTVTENTVCFHLDTVLLCPVKHCYWVQYASIMTQYCYVLWSTFTESTVCFHHDTGMVCPMKQCYWEHSMLSSWHSIVIPCEVLLLRAQYAFIMTQYCYAQWSTVTENTVGFHHDTVLLFPVKYCYSQHSMLSSWHSIAMPNEALLLRTQYAFIMTQYCYALMTWFLCRVKYFYWEHSMLS